MLHKKPTRLDCILRVQTTFCWNGEMSCKEVIWKVLSFNCSTWRKGMVESAQTMLPATSSPANLCFLPCRKLKKRDQAVKVIGLGLGRWSRLCPQPCGRLSVTSHTSVKEVWVAGAVPCRATCEVLRSDGNELHRKSYKYIKFMNIYCTLHTEICQH